MSTAPDRPSATLIVPFLGTGGELDALRERLAGVALRDGDEVLIADNRPGAVDGPGVVGVPERASSYLARNRAAERAGGEWLVFVDADCEPARDLLDAYLAEDAPGDDVGVLAGAIEDRTDEDTLVARYVTARAKMAQPVTLAHPRAPYAQTANCAVRRAAFAQMGGFAAHVRSGGDADLCWHLARAGWRLEARPQARVSHRSRATLRALYRQLARHGAGAAWLEARYPGAFPAPRPRELLGRVPHYLEAALRERSAYPLIDLGALYARDLGRLASNAAPERPLSSARR